MSVAEIEEPPVKSLKDLFHVTGADKLERLSSNALNLQSGFVPAVAKAMEYISDDLAARNATLDGAFLDAGTLSLLFRPKNLHHSLARIGFLDEPIPSVIALTPLAHKEYRAGDMGIEIEEGLPQKFQVHFVIYAPNLAPPNAAPEAPKEVTTEDMFNTFRVLKAEGKGFENNIMDLANIPKGHFTYLKDATGNYITYPADSSDEIMRGKPIAFIRDMNAVPQNENTLGMAEGMGDLTLFLKSLGKTMDDLKPAPKECVEACAQQNLVAEIARAELAVAGIDLNKPLEEPSPAADLANGRTAAKPGFIRK